MTEEILIKQVYSEIDEFLELLDEKTRNEIPANLRKFFKDEKDNEYHKGITPNIPIKEQKLHEETLALIALLNLQYWCKDDAEKQSLMKIYNDNEKKYQEERREKYKSENLFVKKDDKEKTNNSELPRIVKKEGFYKRIIEFIKRILHI